MLHPKIRLEPRRSKGNVGVMTNAADHFAPWLGVFETLRVVDGLPIFVAEHRSELARAMEALSLKAEFDWKKAQAELPSRSGRWRWIVIAGEASTLFSEESVSTAGPIALSISTVRVGSQNWDARFKTLSYLSHAQAWQTGATPEVVLLNEHGHVASAARGNIFWRRGDELFTPAHEAGCRCGVMRGFVLALGKVITGHFPVSDLQNADEIFLTNSLRGIVSVNGLPGRDLFDFASGDKLREEYANAVAAQLQAGLKVS
jgi:4-amino-4-deoxychorismate lyase